MFCVGGKFSSCTFPNVLDCLSIMFISMLITALISSNGEASVAAVSLVTPLTWMITCIFNGISAGGHGGGRPELQA